MSIQPILIDGEWAEADRPVDTFQATNPATGEVLAPTFPVSRLEELERMVEAGVEAAVALRSVSPERIADFLDAYASAIEDRKDELVEWAHTETALPASPRLADIELPRTTDQLRQAADAARERSWRHAIIDTEPNIRSMFEPLEKPVVVMGPNNFPFAFNGMAGGDFAAAIAAGNPVIAKAHPAHPSTTRIFAEAALTALQEIGLPLATVQMFYHSEREDGLKLVSNPDVGAIAFTGSREAGLALKEAADRAGNPIYLEMSSVNPAFILAGALEERGAEIAQELAGSCMLGAGQFCTNAGLVILPEGDESEAFAQELSHIFEETPPGPLLTEGVPSGIADAIAVWQGHGATLVTGGKPLDGPGYRFENTLLRVSGDDFLAYPEALQTEAFGTASLLVFAQDVDQMTEIAGRIEGNLTGSLYTHTEGEDDADYDQIAATLRERVGRLLNDKMPTGVAVTPAMVHGGPYPSTGHPGFTAVGIPTSLCRFAARRCYDNVRPHRLPPELQDKNQTGSMWRYIDREWTQADVGVLVA